MSNNPSATGRSQALSFNDIKSAALRVATQALRSSVVATRTEPVQMVDENCFRDLRSAFSILVPAVNETRLEGRPVTAFYQEQLDSLIAAVSDIIERWDVREASRLIDLFPDAVPPICRLRNIVCSSDGNGEWQVTFALSSRRPASAGPTGEREQAMNYLSGSSGRLKGVLAAVSQAEAAFKAAWDEYASGSFQAEANHKIRSATVEFNKALERAAFAYYLDTSQYNHWSTICQVYAPSRRLKDDMALWFVDVYKPNGVTSMLTDMARSFEMRDFEKTIAGQLEVLREEDGTGANAAKNTAGKPVLVYDIPGGFRDNAEWMFKWLSHAGFSPTWSASESHGTAGMGISIPRVQVAALRELQRTNPARWGNAPGDPGNSERPGGERPRG